MKYKTLLLTALLSSIHLTTLAASSTPGDFGRLTTFAAAPSTLDRMFATDLTKAGTVHVMKESRGQYEALVRRLGNTVKFKDVPVVYAKNAASVPSDVKLVFASVEESEMSVLKELAAKLPKGAKLLVLFQAGVMPPKNLPHMKLLLSNPDFYKGGDILEFKISKPSALSSSSSRESRTSKPSALSVYEKL